MSTRHVSPPPHPHPANLAHRLSYTLAAHIFATAKTTFPHFSLHSTNGRPLHRHSQVPSSGIHSTYTPLATAGTCPTTAKTLHYYIPNSFLASCLPFRKSPQPRQRLLPVPVRFPSLVPVFGSPLKFPSWSTGRPGSPAVIVDKMGFLFI